MMIATWRGIAPWTRMRARSSSALFSCCTGVRIRLP
jgi:hypothetical protein